MRTRSYDVDGEVLAGIELTGDHGGATVVILHGAGESRKEKYLPLMAGLAERGIGSVAFDFSGHGQSTGTLGELSLRRRHRQARGVLADVRRTRGDAPVIVMGFSMSGQTVCDLLAGDDGTPGMPGLSDRTDRPGLSDRTDRGGLSDRTGRGGGTGVPSAAVLCCPAVYAREAYELRFGNAAFTEVLRRPGSWSTSPAFEALLGYRRPMLVVRPELDEVIPEEISARIIRSRPPALTREYIVKGASHQLMRRFADRPAELRRLTGMVAALLGPVPPERPAGPGAPR